MRFEYPTKDLKLLSWFFIALYGVVLIRNAWITDDAYITLRTIENFLAGFGLTYNPSVRVQAFTHPFWALLLSFLYFIQYKVLGITYASGLYFLTLGLSILLSCATVWIVLEKISKPNLISRLFFLMAIIFSKALVDYSTSGLENPLTYFLLVVFLVVYFGDQSNVFLLSLLAALLAFNRLDTILFAVPVLLMIFFSNTKSWKKKIGQLFLGFSPLILWVLFSLFYYGFPFPNTAYAKLNTGIGKSLLLTQGLDYYLNSLRFDPITLLLIVFAGIGIALEKERKAAVVYSGAIIYLLYIVWIGGDFMAGRFFSVPLLVSAILISRFKTFSEPVLLTNLVVFTLIAILSPGDTISGIVTPPEGNFARFRDENGIDDEKTVYFTRSGLTINGFRDAKGGSRYAGSNWQYGGNQKVVVEGAIGLFGYQQGPGVFVIDEFALVDPLLARLPVSDPNNWRIGHFTREIPDGYLESLRASQNNLEDVRLAKYYDHLSYIVSGPLWDWERLITVFRFNTGHYDHYLLSYVQSNP